MMLIAFDVALRGNIINHELDLTVRCLIFLLALACDLGFNVTMFEDFSAYKYLSEHDKDSHEDHGLQTLRH